MSIKLALSPEHESPDKDDGDFSLSNAIDLGPPVSLLALKEAQEHVRGNRYVVLAVLSVAGFMATSATILFGVTAATLASQLDLTIIQSAMLTASPLLCSATIAVPISMLTRSYGARVIVFLLLTATGTAILILAAILQWAANLPSLFPLFVVLGVFVGFGLANVNASVIHCAWWYPGELQGTVAGIFLFSVSMGPAVFGAFAFPAVEAMTISGFFLFWALSILLSGVACLIWAANPPYIQLTRRLVKSGSPVESLPGTSARNLITLHQCRVTQAQVVQICKSSYGQEIVPTEYFVSDLRSSLSSLTNWTVIIIASLSLGTLLGLIVWIPTFFLGVFPLETDGTSAGYIVMGYGFSSAFGCVVAGLLCDRFNYWIWGGIFISISFLCCVCLAVSTIYGLSVAAAVVAGFCTSASNVSAYKLVFTIVTKGSSGTVGWMESFGNLFAFAVPLIFGAIVNDETAIRQSETLRLGMAVPSALMGSCLVSLIVCYIHNRTIKNKI